MKTALPEISRGPVMYIDATPNEEYPLRILRAYRENCNCRWTSELENPLINMMNEMCEQRAEILDKAISILEQGEK